MVSKDPYMLELVVSSEGRHCMDMMLLPRRNHQGRLVIVCQNGAAGVVDLERRTKKQSQMIKRKRTRMLQSRYMH